MHFAPVEFDALGCSGGYKKWVANKYTTVLVNTFISNQGYDEDIKYNLISKPEEIAATISWDKRIIKAQIKIEIDNKTYEVELNGKRFWIEKYNWKVDNIESI